jgi:hypothetical protein
VADDRIHTTRRKMSANGAVVDLATSVDLYDHLETNPMHYVTDVISHAVSVACPKGIYLAPKGAGLWSGVFFPRKG